MTACKRLAASCHLGLLASLIIVLLSLHPCLVVAQDYVEARNGIPVADSTNQRGSDACDASNLHDCNRNGSIEQQSENQTSIAQNACENIRIPTRPKLPKGETKTNQINPVLKSSSIIQALSF